MRYILFCNEGYGRLFENAFRRWCSASGADDFVIVRSAKDARVDRSFPARLKRLATGRGGHVVTVENVNDPAFAQRWLALKSDLFGVVAGFNQIFREETIRRFTALLNFHPSLLPYYRGPVPSWWCIHNGETTTGVTLHVVTAEIDAGPILWQSAVPIRTRDDAALDQEIARAGATVLPDVLQCLQTNEPLPTARLDASRLYRTRAGYQSFPEQEEPLTGRAGAKR